MGGATHAISHSHCYRGFGWRAVLGRVFRRGGEPVQEERVSVGVGHHFSKHVDFGIGVIVFVVGKHVGFAKRVVHAERKFGESVAIRERIRIHARHVHGQSQYLDQCDQRHVDHRLCRAGGAEAAERRIHECRREQPEQHAVARTKCRVVSKRRRSCHSTAGRADIEYQLRGESHRNLGSSRRRSYELNAYQRISLLQRRASRYYRLALRFTLIILGFLVDCEISAYGNLHCAQTVPCNSGNRLLKHLISRISSRNKQLYQHIVVVRKRIRNP